MQLQVVQPSATHISWSILPTAAMSGRLASASRKGRDIVNAAASSMRCMDRSDGPGTHRCAWLSRCWVMSMCWVMSLQSKDAQHEGKRRDQNLKRQLLPEYRSCAARSHRTAQVYGKQCLVGSSRSALLDAVDGRQHFPYRRRRTTSVKQSGEEECWRKTFESRLFPPAGCPLSVNPVKLSHFLH